MNSYFPSSRWLHSLRADSRTRRPALFALAIASCCFLFFLTSSRTRGPEYRTEQPYAYPPTRTAPDRQLDEAPNGPGSLQARAVSLLDALDARPIHEYGPALEQESQPGRCPNTWRQANRDMMRNEGENVWPSMAATDLARARRRVIDRVKDRFGWEQEARPKTELELEVMLGQRGRGIVVTAGK